MLAFLPIYDPFFITISALQNVNVFADPTKIPKIPYTSCFQHISFRRLQEAKQKRSFEPGPHNNIQPKYIIRKISQYHLDYSLNESKHIISVITSSTSKSKWSQRWTTRLYRWVLTTWSTGSVLWDVKKIHLICTKTTCRLANRSWILATFVKSTLYGGRKYANGPITSSTSTYELLRVQYPNQYVGILMDQTNPLFFFCSN